MNFTTKTSLLALGMLTSLHSVANACSCMEPTISASFDSSTDVAIVRIEGRKRRGGDLYYSAKVRRSFKGCTESEEMLILATPGDSAACGETSLRAGRNYLIFGDEDGTFRRKTVLDINLCDYNTPVRELTRRDWHFLRSNLEECPVDPECNEYEVDEFGPCEMVLGYGVSAESGTCAAISGCELPSYATLYNSMDECIDACEID